jgi:hypothetical protein
VIVVEFTTETTLAVWPLMITDAPVKNPEPVNVIVSPPAVLVAVSSPVYAMLAMVGTVVPVTMPVS